MRITTPIISRPATGKVVKPKAQTPSRPARDPAMGVNPGVATRAAKGASAKATAGTNALLDSLAGSRSGVGRLQKATRPGVPVQKLSRK